MYSCPTDDIHSIYLDNELPLAYLKEYESHIANCKACKAKLETLRKIKDTFQSDSKNIQLDEQFMNQSFERLKTKMRYSKNTVQHREFPFSEKTVRWGMAAAAAVIIAAILPVTISNSTKANYSENANIASITPVTRPQNAPIANRNVVINGNLNHNLAQTVGSRNISNSALTNVDVLRPEFDDARKIHVNITVPGLEDNPETIEIKLPVNANEGQLEWTRHR